MELVQTANHLTVDNLLDSFHLAAERHNLKAYFGCFHRDGTFLGTDATENWNMEAFMEFSKPYFDSGKGWTYLPVKDSRKFNMLGNASALICTFDEILHSKSLDIPCRGSGTLLREGNSQPWFILSYHLSIPLPNDFVSSSFCNSLKAFNGGQAQAKADKAALELLAEIDKEEKTSAEQKQNSMKNKKKGKGK